jgi:hypothetical protein
MLSLTDIITTHGLTLDDDIKMQFFLISDNFVDQRAQVLASPSPIICVTQSMGSVQLLPSSLSKANSFAPSSGFS